MNSHVPLILTRPQALQYTGLTRDMFDEAVRLGIITPLNRRGARGALLFDRDALEPAVRRYLDRLKAVSGAEPAKATPR
jgi:hypothetical protein